MRPWLLVLVMVLAACGAQQSQPLDEPSPTPASRSTQASGAGVDTITGTLGGDPQLEGGCAWIDDGRTRWQVQYPPGWQLSWEPLTLTGPDGQTAGEGDTVTLTGAEQTDVMTTCQIGPVWAATDVVLGEG